MRAACCEATVLRHEVIADDIRLLRVLWPDRDHAPHAGQFFTLRAWGADEAPFLSRPISVHKWEPETQTVEFLYQVIGEGTHKLAALKEGDSFQLTGPMGNGFDVESLTKTYKKFAVVGGGIGTAPMYQVARELAAAGCKAIIYTDIACDGAMQGTNLALYRQLSAEVPGVEFTASGGISSEAELLELERMGVAAAILGKSLYTGALDLARCVQLVQK